MRIGRVAESPLNLSLLQDWRPAALAGALLLAGCGGNGGEPSRARDAPAVRGAALVAGTSLQEWSLLEVPRAGGQARLRAIDDPDDTLWTGETRLPPSSAAYPLADSTVILHAPGGELYRYEPGADLLKAAGRAERAGAPAADGGRRAWIDRGGSSVVVLSSGKPWTVRADGPVRWAAPAEDEAVALVREEAGSPGVLRLALAAAPTGASPPAAAETRELLIGPRVLLPGVATAWGRRLVFADPQGDGILLASAPQMEIAGRFAVGGPVAALAASPSSHEMYVAVSGTGRGAGHVLAIDRFSGRRRTLAKLEEPVRALRPSLLGGFLIAGLEDRVAFLALEGGRTLALGSEWREDLPLGLPGDRILAVEGDRLFLWSAEDRAGAERRLDASADAWWLPLHWRPAGQRLARADVSKGRGPARAEEEAVPGAGAVAREASEAPGEGEIDAGAEEAGATGESSTASEAAPEGGPGPGRVRLPPGFYAIVASSLAPGGIVGLAERLTSAGFPASVQRHRDEASELWFRTLVGPYETREEAEAAARQLRRERGLQAWISEIGPDAVPEEPDG